MLTYPVEFKINPLPDNFWEGESETLYNILLPLFTKAARDSALSSFNNLVASVDIGVSWDVVNSVATIWAEQHTAEVVRSVSRTSMAAFLENFDPWVQSGEPLSALIDALEPFYGQVRAEMVAVTEVTRAYALGNISAWSSTGVVIGFDVMTAEDDLVCPICDGEVSNNPHDMSEDPPPYHVRCRCYLRPVLSE